VSCRSFGSRRGASSAGGSLTDALIEFVAVVINLSSVVVFIFSSLLLAIYADGTSSRMRVINHSCKTYTLSLLPVAESTRCWAEHRKKSNSFLVVHWTYRQCYTHTQSYKNLLGSSPNRYARGSANRLNAVIASTTQLGSPRNHTPALDSGLPVYARICIMMLLYRRHSMACRPSAVAVRSDFS